MTEQTVKKSLAWMGGMSLVGQILTWSATIIIARLLSPQDYGLVSITGIFTVIAHSVCLMGISSAVIQAEEVTNYQIRALYGFSIYAGCIMYLIGLLAAPVMTMIFHEPRLTQLLAVQNLVFIVGAPKSLQLSLMARDTRFDIIAKIEVGSRILTSICALLMAALGCGVWTLALQWLLIELFQLLAFYRYPRGRIVPTFVILWKEIRDFLVFGVKVLLQSIIWQLYTSVDVFIFGRLATQGFLGAYTFSKNLTNMPFEKIISIINRVLLPYLAKNKNDQEHLRKWTLEATDLQLLLIAPIFYLLFFCAKEIVLILLGNGWIAAIFPFQIFAISNLFKMVQSYVSMILTAMGRVNEDRKSVV
jgi:O-antigen/teichoic acid export membrane protein